MIFRRRVEPVEESPDETTQDRKKMIANQRKKLKQTQSLKVRSAAVAKDLQAEGSVNHYALRLRIAYQLSGDE